MGRLFAVNSPTEDVLCITVRCSKINQTAAVLNALASKIRINQDLNQTPKQMVQAIFKSWFVDFAPVRARIAARKRWHALQSGNEPASPVCYAPEPQGQPFDTDLESYMNLAAMQAISGKTPDQLTRLRDKQPGQYAELVTTAELFPSAMQESDLGEIPEGWKLVPFGNSWLSQNRNMEISRFLAEVFLENGIVITPTEEIQFAFYRMVMPLLTR